MKRLGHLNALRAFDIVARAGSFAKAAVELCVTPAAVSQQIRQLEGYLEIELFHRQKQRLVLTEAARQLLPDIATGFEHLTHALKNLDGRPGDRPRAVHVAAPPAFVTQWLVPRLSDFRRSHPGVELHIESCGHAVDLVGGQFDLQVRYGLAERVGVEITPLFTDGYIPVCTPLVRARVQATDGPQADCQLIHEEGSEFDLRPPRWDAFLQRFDIRVRPAASPLRFSDPQSATLAALEGCGVLLGRHYVVAEHLTRGTLVHAFAPAAMVGPTYQVVHAVSQRSRPDLQAVKLWLSAQTSNMRMLVGDAHPWPAQALRGVSGSRDAMYA